MVQDSLFILVKTLTKAEKRKFKLFASKTDGKSSLYVSLFDLIDKMDTYDESLILQKNKQIKNDQLGNLKIHLYKNILTSLRLIDKEKLGSMRIGEEIDYARVLYNKGLYKQSLKILEHAKSLCAECNDSIQFLQIVEFEKTIQLRHITQSGYLKAKQIIETTRSLVCLIDEETRLSNLCLSMYGLYVEHGLVKNDEDAKKISSFFAQHIPKIEVQELPFNQKVSFYQAHTWRAYILQNVLQYYKYSQQWQACYDGLDIHQTADIEPLLRAKHHVFNALFFASDGTRLEKETLRFEKDFWEQNELFSTNLQSQIFMDYFFAKINLVFLKGNFAESLSFIEPIQEGLKIYQHQLDIHKTLIFYYKIACIYFGNQDYERAIDYLNKIINMKAGDIRTDLQCFSRMLHLIAHFELENNDILDSLMKSLYRFLFKHQNNSPTLLYLIQFLKKAIKSRREESVSLFEQLLHNLRSVLQNPYEKRTFLYLDVISYLESKISGVPISVLIQQKHLHHTKRF